MESSKELKNTREEPNKLLPSYYYMEGERIIFTEEFHINRGGCCGNGCRHCPYEPKHTKGRRTLIKK